MLADSPPVQGCSCISDLTAVAYVSDPLPGMILEAIETHSGLQEITVATCIEDNQQVRYR